MLVHKIGKTEQFGGAVVDRDIEIPRMHQLVDNAMQCREELLQVVRAAALLRHAIERLTEGLHTPAVRDVVVPCVKTDNFAIEQYRSAGNRYVEERTVFFATFGL